MAEVLGEDDATAGATNRPWVTLGVGALAVALLAAAALVDVPFAFEIVRLGGLPSGWLSVAEAYRLITHPFAPLDLIAGAGEIALAGLLLVELERRAGWAFTAVLVIVTAVVAAAVWGWLMPSAGVLAGIAPLAYAAFAARVAAYGLGPRLTLGPVALPMAVALAVLLLMHAFYVGIADGPYRSLFAYGIALLVGALLGVWLRNAAVPSQLAVGLLALALGSFIALAMDARRTPAQTVAERWLTAMPNAALALDIGEVVATDARAPRSLLERSFAVVSDVELPGYAGSLEGSVGVQRADTLAVLAWRAGMLGEARGHGLDAALRARGERTERASRLLARLATYEQAARLPQFVPAAVLVRANTLCVLIPSGNPRQFIRAIAARPRVSGDERVLGIVLGTVDPGETRCVAAAGVPADARVVITAAERAVLTADLRYHAVLPGAAALLPRG